MIGVIYIEERVERRCVNKDRCYRHSPRPHRFLSDIGHDRH
jgi:hypothetical protein